LVGDLLRWVDAVAVVDLLLQFEAEVLVEGGAHFGGALRCLELAQSLLSGAGSCEPHLQREGYVLVGFDDSRPFSACAWCDEHARSASRRELCAPGRSTGSRMLWNVCAALSRRHSLSKTGLQGSHVLLTISTAPRPSRARVFLVLALVVGGIGFADIGVIATTIAHGLCFVFVVLCLFFMGGPDQDRATS
jgi:hypothetical protein